MGNLEGVVGMETVVTVTTSVFFYCDYIRQDRVMEETIVFWLRCNFSLALYSSHRHLLKGHLNM